VCPLLLQLEPLPQCTCLALSLLPDRLEPPLTARSSRLTSSCCLLRGLPLLLLLLCLLSLALPLLLLLLCLLSLALPLLLLLLCLLLLAHPGDMLLLPERPILGLASLWLPDTALLPFWGLLSRSQPPLMR